MLFNLNSNKAEITYVPDIDLTNHILVSVLTFLLLCTMKFY